MLLLGTAAAVEPTERDIEYATVDSHRLLLDIYQPRDAISNGTSPLVIWIHGGAWRAGSKTSVPVKRLLDHGFAIASVDYRLSPVAKFPAQVHDIKAAIRFLRANADGHNFDTNRFFIAGSSAGGHLAALVGVTNGHKELRRNRLANISAFRQMFTALFRSMVHPTCRAFSRSRLHSGSPCASPR